MGGKFSGKMSASVIEPGLLSNMNSNHKSVKNRGSANTKEMETLSII